MVDVDVIIVGAGLAGISCGYKLAKKGKNVLILERGAYPGSKNVSGGRMYLHAIKKLLPEISIYDIPFERFVTREILTFVSDNSSVSIEYNQFYTGEPLSATVLRAKFDKWFASLAEEKGATIITNTKVDDVILDNGKVCGIIAGNDRITSNVVVIAEGANSFIPEKLGLRKAFNPDSMTVAAKGIIELGEDEINKRFGLKGREGVACAFIGITQGVQGGGFLYTDKDHISIGVVCLLESLVKNKISIADLFEYYRLHPAVQRYIEGGRLVEYSGHLTPELGFNMIPKLVMDGLLIAGDAAAFFLEGGPILRGMDFAIESGSLAAEAIEYAYKQNDFTEKTLNIYYDLLNNSFVLRDLKRYKNSPIFMKNPRLYSTYPKIINKIFEEYMKVDGTLKPPLGKTILKIALSETNPFLILKDLIEASLYL